MNFNRVFLHCCSILALAVTLPAYAQDESKRLQPRVDFTYMPDQDRNIATTKIWVPLSQDLIDKTVVYGETIGLWVIITANHEFNAGVGYRKMIRDVPVFDEGIWGVHGWYDRRLTRSGSQFNQITVGGEWFSDVLDVKSNVYYPLNEKNDFVREKSGWRWPGICR